MPELMLTYTIVPVGPRQDFELTAPSWRFALQVAASFDQKPATDQQRACLEAMLPWRAFPHGSIPLRWQVYRDNEHTGIAGDVEARLARELDLKGLTAPLLSQLEASWLEFGSRKAPPRTFSIDTTGAPVKLDQDQIPLPMVLPAFGGATPALTSGVLRVTWYFEIPLSPELVEAIETTSKYPLLIAAWPREFVDIRSHHHFHHDEVRVPINRNRRVSIEYVNPATGKPEIRAVTRALSLNGLDKSPEPALLSYWLPASDSRLESLADLAGVVGEALRPEARTSALTPEILASAGIPLPDSADPMADARAFLELASREFTSSRKADPPAKKEVQTVILAALAASRASGKSLLEELRAHLDQESRAWWPSAVEAINRRAAREGKPTRWQPGHPELLFGPYLKRLLPDQAAIRPVLPGEGLDLLLGEPGRRLRPESDDDADTGNNSDHAQIAELGVLVRRARKKEQLAQRDWSLATAAVAVLGELDGVSRFWGSVIDPEAGIFDEELPYDPEPVVRGLTCAFVDGLASNEVSYRGLPLSVATVGSALHGVPGIDEAGPSMPQLLPLSFQAVGPVKNQVDNSDRCLVPPLRYGDYYQFAGFVIDRAGGLPDELAARDPQGRVQHPPVFDWSQLAAGRLVALDDFAASGCPPIHFLRRVPVGEVNIVPLGNQDREGKPQWPALPAEVVLRSREWLNALSSEADQVPALLLSDGPTFTRQLPAASFRAGAPRLDEHTLSRWRMPAALAPGEDPATALAELARLDAELAEIHRQRAALPSETDWQAAPYLPFDPAVAAIGLRCQRIDGVGTVSETRQLLPLDATVSCFVRDPGNLPAGAQIALLPGTFAVLELVPLVANADFERFDAKAMESLVEGDPWVADDGKTYMAFRATRILVEAATSELPAAAELFDALKLQTLTTGAIEVTLEPNNGAPLPQLAFVDRFELARQRWVWRNRPIIDPDREAWQSELPADLFKPEREKAISVLRFDALSELDRGLVDRGRIGGRLPRKANGEPLPNPRLLVDDRDGVSHADYLRFGCTLLSRYHGILEERWRKVVARCKHGGGPENELEPESRRIWRRVTAPYRGDSRRIKAPKVLAILPLTQALEGRQPADISANATPFLIVLDEIFFREYGVGEKLQVELVLETKEIGHGDEEQRPFRVGPLPDHYLSTYLEGPSFEHRFLYEGSTDAVQDQKASHCLPVFGPFGFSLDRSGNEAFANATAFVVYPPAKVGPHYAAYVRLRRLVQANSGEIPGPPGGTYALYTQPDAADLAPTSTTEPLRLADQWSGRPLHLRPLEQAAAPVSRQYAYLLLFGPMLRDRSRGTDLLLPKHAAWLEETGRTIKWVGEKPQSGKEEKYSGRVLELLLNGRAPKGKSLEDAADLKSLLAALFVAEGYPEDAPAMIRRMSAGFPVELS